jgi:hypothetical protein
VDYAWFFAVIGVLSTFAGQTVSDDVNWNKIKASLLGPKGFTFINVFAVSFAVGILRHLPNCFSLIYPINHG